MLYATARWLPVEQKSASAPHNNVRHFTFFKVCCEIVSDQGGILIERIHKFSCLHIIRTNLKVTQSFNKKEFFSNNLKYLLTVSGVLFLNSALARISFFLLRSFFIIPELHHAERAISPIEVCGLGLINIALQTDRDTSQRNA